MSVPAAFRRLSELRVLLRTGAKFVNGRPLTLVTVKVSQLPITFVTPGYLAAKLWLFAAMTRYLPDPRVVFDGQRKLIPPLMRQPERFTLVGPALNNSTYSSRGSWLEGWY